MSTVDMNDDCCLLSISECYIEQGLNAIYDKHAIS